MSDLIIPILYDVSYVVLALIMLMVAKITLDVLTPFRVDDQVTSRDNPAFGLSLTGYLSGVLVIFIGAYFGDSYEETPFWLELLLVAGWSALGIVLLNVSRVVLDVAVFHRFSTRHSIIENHNTSMGVVEFGTYVGSSLVVAGAISGEGGGIGTALVFYLLGQLGLVLYALLYQVITRYDFHREIERANVAAGVAYAGNICAMGLLMMKGTSGDFVSWKDNLAAFGWYTAAAFVLLILGRFAVDLLLMPKRTLHEEIVNDRNVCAGYLEGSILPGLASVIFFAI